MAIAKYTKCGANIRDFDRRKSFDEVTVCAKCKHLRRGLFWVSARCKAEAVEELNIITGVLTVREPLCTAVNNGKCTYFEEI